MNISRAFEGTLRRGGAEGLCGNRSILSSHWTNCCPSTDSQLYSLLARRRDGFDLNLCSHGQAAHLDTCFGRRRQREKPGIEAV